MDNAVPTREMSFEWSQFNCLPDRPGGYFACSHIAKLVLHGFLATDLSLSQVFNDQQMRDLTMKGVQACDASYQTKGGAPDTFSLFQEDLPHNMRILSEASTNKHEICRLLCRDIPPFCSAVTAFKVFSDESSGFVTRTGYTISIFCDQGAYGCFDSHVAKAWMVEGQGVRAAEALVEELCRHFSQQGCETSQLEVITLLRNDVDVGCRGTVIQQLKARGNPAVVDRFAAVAPIVLDRWTHRLDCIGDVDACWHLFTDLRHKEYASPHWIPPWLCPSLFFIMHQLRFTRLMPLFSRLVLDTAELWQDQSEEAFEAALQKNMAQIISGTLQSWAETHGSGSDDVLLIKERALVPNKLLQYIGGYSSGPKAWKWVTFPFKPIGRALLDAMKPSSDVAKIRRHIIRILPAEVHCNTYSVTHKIRTLTVCYGLLGSFADSWCACESMSKSNAATFSDLGKPSTQQFEILTCRRSPAWEFGYQMCVVIAVCKKYSQLIEKNPSSFVMELSSLPRSGDVWHSPEMALSHLIKPEDELEQHAPEAELEQVKMPVGGAFGMFRAALRLQPPAEFSGLSASGQSKVLKRLWQEVSEETKQHHEQEFQQRLAAYHAARRARKAEQPSSEVSEAPLDIAPFELPKVPVGGAFGVFRAALTQDPTPEYSEQASGCPGCAKAVIAKRFWEAASADTKQKYEQEFQRRLATYHERMAQIPEAAKKKARLHKRQANREAGQPDQPVVPVGGGFAAFWQARKSDKDFISEVKGLSAVKQAKWVKSLWEKLPPDQKTLFDNAYAKQLAAYHASKS